MYALLAVLLLPTLGVPFVYLTGKKSPKLAAIFLAVIALVDIALILSTIPTILSSTSSRYVESYPWIPTLNNTNFALFVDGISASIAVVALVLILAASLFSIKYMEGKRDLPVYYALLTLLSVGLVGVFITSNLVLFYVFWELMLVPAFFIIGGWGYKKSHRTAFQFFVYTHIGAVFVLLGIGAVYIATGGATDMFTAQAALMTANPGLVQGILLALTAGFAVKMAIVPVHMWLPDAYSESPAPMSALLSGVMSSAGAYAILRLSLGMVLPSLINTSFGINFLHGLAVFGVISAFFGSLIALVKNDIKQIVAYSSISHMGYILFGLSIFSTAGALNETALSGTVLHIITHGVSKGLFFLSAGALMFQLGSRDIREMGGLAEKMPFTGTASAVAAFSLGGVPPFACFISEFLIFVGAFTAINNDSFYILPTALMLVATVISLGYSLRFVARVFMGPPKEGTKILKIPAWMKVSMGILVVFVIILGVYPSFFINLISTVHFAI
jgi:NADH-quinone oxidoreductase subunit M